MSPMARWDVIVRHLDRQIQDEGAPGLAVGVEGEGRRDATRKCASEDKVQSADVRQLVPDDFPPHQIAIQCPDAFNSDLVSEDWVVAFVVRNHANIRRVAFVTRSSVSQFPERQRLHAEMIARLPRSGRARKGRMTASGCW